MSAILVMIYLWAVQSGFVMKDGVEMIHEQRVAIRQPIPYAAATFEKAVSFCETARKEFGHGVMVECRYFEVIVQDATQTERASAHIRRIGGAS